MSRQPPTPRGRGVRVLSLDGGGTRGLVTIEMLKELERQTGRRIHELFDVIAGTSTGGILAAGLQEGLPLQELEQLYLELASEIFVKEYAPRRGVQLLLTGATYKAARLEHILKRIFHASPPAAGQEAAAAAATSEASTMLDRRSWQAAECARRRESPPPLLLIVSCLASRAPPVPFLFRNYEYLPGARRRYAGSAAVPLWQALRATTAAPTYFPAFQLRSPRGDARAAGPPTAAAADADGAGRPLATASTPADATLADGTREPGVVLQDGALLANNPAALALHEARLLYPGCEIDVLASFGTGAFAPASTRPGTWAETMATLVRAATRTEEVHLLLSELLPARGVAYCRFNPTIPPVSLDETSPQRLRELQALGREFVAEGGAGRAECVALAGLLAPAPGAGLGALFSWPARLLSRLRSRL